ncbi:MAG: DUF4272 domain-containing protein [Phycisphaerales bacterium JB063]
MNIDTEDIKAESERFVIQNGGQICDWLPYIEPTTLRDPDAVIARALILNAMINLYFKAPTSVVKDWLDKYQLTGELSPVEADILSRSTDELTDQEKINLYWYIEALWAFLWATNMIETWDFTTGIPNTMASLCPNLERNEGPEKFTERMELRDYEELYKERDLYYRVMWWARQSNMTGQQDSKFDLSRTLERRRALEWMMDATLEWDEVPLNT